MGNKTSIYIDHSLQKIIDARVSQDGRQVSAIITTMAVRYAFLCSKYVPKFIVDDWCFIFAALAGFPADMTSLARSMILQYRSRYNSVEWRVSKTFRNKITLLSDAEIVAVLDAAERFYLKNLLEYDDNNYAAIAAVVGEENILR